ncbi:sensor histidine kinase [Puia dinghuensis]|uniref:Signal transduction histidine kinase internal region domain-containing protein n=1 Tax=Puia dinghuensis TaxID=1792502 RepID=A0A8J2UCI2_9BACT|nr:histidine kinase [Puia dinghuensis]GGA96731.1 hypothetical protein GCM10011511_20030 [Puia dinghuensis]
MKKTALLLILAAVALRTQAQTQAQALDTVPAHLDWDNYSTSFQGNGKEGVHPVLVTAIPYNGIYGGASYFSTTSEKLHLADSFYIPDEKRPRYIGASNTMDSGNVYFLAPGIHPANADKYEFRIVVDGWLTYVPWSPITRFTEPKMELNDFKPIFGFLGGYQTTWGHSVLAEIREKATKTIQSSAVVYWTNARPTLSGIYTAQNLKSFVAGKHEYGSWKPDSAMNLRLEQLYQGKLQLQPGDNTLIFFIDAEVYQRQAVEYQLLRNGQVDSAWKPNDFDNNIVFLQNLPPGKYTLQLRLRAQRHNVSAYSFTIRPAWYETRLFKFLLGAMLVLSIGAVILAFIFLRQRRKTRREQAAREKLNLELGYIRSQLNPHFIFNALNSIQGLVNKKEIDTANRYLSEFGSLLRDSLAVSADHTGSHDRTLSDGSTFSDGSTLSTKRTGGDNDLTDLQREIRILDSYCHLEQLRFGFRYTITTAPGLPDTGIPAFLLQPIVENAVKHGVSGLLQAGLIQIHFSRENANFIAQVTDNGRGWDTTVATTGYGLRLTSERIRLLNQLLKDQPINMTITSSPGAGATVRFQFTNWWT